MAEPNGLNLVFQFVELAAALLGLIAFFDIWFSVRSIKQETRKQSKFLRLMALTALGQSLIGTTGTTQGIVDQQSENSQVLIDGDLWNCRADTTIQAGQNVRVKAVEGLAVHVEEAK